MSHAVPTVAPAAIRGHNMRALCLALEARGVSGSRCLSAAFGPSMTPERLRGVLSGAPLPDFLARSIEHMMCVPMYWLDEVQPDVREPAGHLLVEQALRTESPETAGIPAEVIADLPLPLDA
jgi:hypothetical protein